MSTYSKRAIEGQIKKDLAKKWCFLPGRDKPEKYSLIN
jgi:hypothetical protein